jgi:hypothetical protein
MAAGLVSLNALRPYSLATDTQKDVTELLNNTGGVISTSHAQRATPHAGLALDEGFEFFYGTVYGAAHVGA